MSTATPGSRSICLFIGSLKAGGAERVTLWLARELVARGHRVTVLTHHGTDQDFFALPPGVSRAVVGLTEGSNSLPGKLMLNIRRCLRVRAVLKNARADTILAMMPHESVVAVVAATALRTRVVVSERNAPWHRRQDRIWTAMRRLVYRFSAAQVAQTQPIADWLAQHAGSTRLHIIPNAVQDPLPSGTPVIAPPTRPGRRLVVAAGTKPWQKGFDLLLEAFTKVAADHPDWDLVLPGLLPDRVEEGLSGQDILDRAAAAGLASRVILPGHVGNMPDWYGAADLFILSSRFEGFPNVLVEAMSQGCACVAFDCDTGPRDILTDGVDGLLVAQGDTEALARAMARTMGDDPLRARLGEAARDVRTRYASARIMDLWCTALDVPQGTTSTAASS